MTSPFIIRRWDNALPLQSKCMLFAVLLHSALQWRCNTYAVSLQHICSSAATRLQSHCNTFAVTLQQMCSDADPVGVYGIVSCFVKKIL